MQLVITYSYNKKGIWDRQYAAHAMSWRSEQSIKEAIAVHAGLDARKIEIINMAIVEKER